MITRFGNTFAYASNIPIPPDAPMVGYMPPVIVVTSTCNSPADTTLAKYSCRIPCVLEVFQLAAEHPQTVHVESDVDDAAVQERIGHQLPGHEGAVHRPQRETGIPCYRR